MPAPATTYAMYRLFFRDNQGNGYSEVYVQKPTSWIGEDFQTTLDDLFGNRLDCLNHKSRIVYGSVSDVGLSGDILALATNAGNAGTVNDDPMGAGDAIYGRIKAAFGVWAGRLWRGISKGDETADGELNGSGPTPGGIETLVDYLHNHHFGVLHFKPTRRFAQWSFQEYEDVVKLQRIGHRDVGRPFGLLRGRRR